MKSLNELKQQGRILRKHLEQAFSATVPLAKAYEAIAVIEGAKDWNTLASLALAPRVTQNLPTTAGAAPSFVLDIELGFPQHEELVNKICEEVWNNQIEEWANRASRMGCEYLIDSGLIFEALGSYGVTATNDDNFDDEAERVIEKTLHKLGYLRRARQLYEGKLTLAEAGLPIQEPARANVAAKVEADTTQLASLCTILDINLVDVLNEYDAPDETPEWGWVEEHASFSHTGNNQDPGVWEFMLHVERAASLQDIPELIKPFIARAVQEKAAWLMFHQG